jgi:ribosomal protein L40E
MQDDNLLDLVNSAIATLLEIKQRLENGEGIPTEPKDPEKGWEPVEFFDNLPGRVSETMQEEVSAQYTPEPAPQIPVPPPPVIPPPVSQVPVAPAPAPKAGTRFCRNCGAELQAQAKFCRSCGQKIE